MTIRTRIASSPTGFFHIGTARTALYNYLFAKKQKGVFIVRMEDTDVERSKKSYEEDILEGLHFLGLNYDEGPDIGGPYGPYRQSERLDLYKQYAKRLVKKGLAYYCRCSPELLEKEKETAKKEGRTYRYSGRCRNARYTSGALRFKVTGGRVRFKDLIRGEIEEDSGLWGDFLIVRSDGRPLFHFSNLIDDAEMAISHVIRGDDHISNTFRQIVIQQALNLPQPLYAHLPMLVNADRSKISKRRNPVSVTYDFRVKGFLPEALVNYLALLGWAPSDNREIFSLEELISEFDIGRIQKSSAAWDQRKLEFLNGYYIARLKDEDLAERLGPFLVGLSKEELRKLAPMLKGRIKTLLEAKELASFAISPCKPKKEFIPAKGSDIETARKALKTALALLKDQPFDIRNFEERLNDFITQNSLKRGDVLWPLRYALTGSLYSPGAFEVLDYLGQGEALTRLEKALKILDAPK